MQIATIMQVSVRELKNNLSKYLRIISQGEHVTVTSHNKPVASLRSISSPPGGFPDIPGVHWAKKKPDYTMSVDELPKISGKALSQTLLDDR